MGLLMRRTAVVLATLFTVLAGSVVSADAGVTDYSIWLYYGPVAGITYQNQSSISTNSIMTGGVTVEPKNGATIPGGWSGGQASIYLNGALCSSAAMYYYPDSTAYGWSGGITVRNCGSGNYTARGSTAAYNGSGYNYYYTATSPILTH